MLYDSKGTMFIEAGWNDLLSYANYSSNQAI